MTSITERTPVVSWTEPDGISPRGTLIMIPGRGEQPGLYERFGRRISSDGYRVHVVANPVQDVALAISQVLSQPVTVHPYVLAGSDPASGQVTNADALILVGLPVVDAAGSAELAPWDAELDTRTACPVHRGRLAGSMLRRGALREPVPDRWASLADLERVVQPVLCVHGADDQVSPLAVARARYAAAPRAQLVSSAGGRHDALNDITHRTVAATIILFLERLRLGADLPPIATSENL
jgi:alpha-beta hydrolase superfamily lysophospholipase